MNDKRRAVPLPLMWRRQVPGRYRCRECGIDWYPVENINAPGEGGSYAGAVGTTGAERWDDHRRYCDALAFP